MTGLLQIQIGNLIQPTNTTGIVVLTQVNPISVVFILPNADIASVQEAMARGPVHATVYDQSGSKQLDVGTLLAINNQAATTTGAVLLKGIFPNHARQLWPGTFVNVDLITSVVPNALTIPTNALQQNDKGQFVYVVGEDKRVSARPVEVAQRRRGVALISKGLQAGETVVVQGQYRLTPGTLVAPTAPSEARTPHRQFRNAAVNLSSGFITRPIATALMMVAVVALGIVGYRLLPVAASPNIDTPTIQVTAQMPGADPQTMASSVTIELERQFGEIPGLSQMTSSSGTGFVEITLQFDRSRTVNSAAEDVQAAINATQAQLPISLLTSPIYRKTNPADTPILLVAMTSDVLPIMTVSDYAYSILAQKVSQVPGVGLVTVGGNLSPAIRIELNPASSPR